MGFRLSHSYASLVRRSCQPCLHIPGSLVAFLLDTNILLRLGQPSHPMHQEVRRCVRTLFRQKEIIYIVLQVIFEFWVVATRPVAGNGLGLSLESARRMVDRAEFFFRLVLDTPSIYREWLRLIEAHAVSGLPAHDARIVAAMRVHGIERLVTFNTEDFKRYHQKEITVFSPGEVLASLATQEH